jgi:PAS domain-containing protein
MLVIELSRDKAGQNRTCGQYRQLGRRIQSGFRYTKTPWPIAPPHDIVSPFSPTPVWGWNGMKQHPIQHMLGTLYAAPLRPALWDSFLSQISALCGIRKAALICHNVPQGTHRILATLGSEVAASVQTYESHYFQFDEWTLRFPKRGSRGRVIRGEEIWQESSLLKSTFYNEFLKPFDTYQMACVGYGDAPGNFEALSVYRGLNEESFTRETMALLELLVPHLDTALTLRRKLGHLEGHASDLENALDAIAPGIILLDRNGRCIFINKSAQAILDERDGLFSTNLTFRREAIASLQVCASCWLRRSLDTSEKKASLVRCISPGSRDDR